jgi:DNA-directed RNA polymerase specialized sigma24 family protein
MSAHKDEWPSDLSALARIAVDASQPPDRRDRALRDLQPLFRQTARRVAARRGFRCPDLIEELVSHTWMKFLQLTIDEGSIAGWVFTVMSRRLIDLMRTAGRRKEESLEKLGLDTFAAESAHDAIESALDQESRFSSDDLEILAAWPVRRRLVVLSLALLWPRVPGELWDRWVQEAQARPPVPPNGFADLEQPGERYAALAASLGMLPNTLCVTWSRHVGRLAELPFLRRLRDDR